MNAHIPTEATPARLIRPNPNEIDAAVTQIRTALRELTFQAWKTGRHDLNERPDEDAAVTAFDEALDNLVTLALGIDKEETR